jgi:hypothetical protein
MGVVQLPLRRYKSHAIGPHILYLEQVVALLRIVRRGGPAVLRESVVDTGSPLTIFPQKVWRQFEKEIRWLTKWNDPSVPKWCRQFSGVAGGTTGCRLGLVQVEIFDLMGGRIGPTEIVAMFASDRGRMRDIVLGLGGGIFAKRRLEMIYDVPTIVLTDV